MRPHNRMLLYAMCIGLLIVIIITGIIDFPFADIAQTVCGIVVRLCMLVFFVSLDQQNDASRDGSLIVNDADEVYLVMNQDISELRKKSHVDMAVYLSHSS